jgi:hypothetical protein
MAEYVQSKPTNFLEDRSVDSLKHGDIKGCGSVRRSLVVSGEARQDCKDERRKTT